MLKNWFVFLLIAGFLLTACTAPTTTAVEQSPLVITDGLGRSITLSAPAQRVVSLSPSNTEILFAVGAGAQVVGRDSFSNYPQEVNDLPDIGGSFSEYDLEAILALQPDLVLAAEINTPELVQSLQDLGLTVFYLANPSDLDGMFQMLRTVATLTGHQEQTEQLVASLQARVQAVRDRVAQAKNLPTVFYELDASDPLKPFTPGPGTFYTSLIAEAGGVNIAATLSSAWAQISLEELLVQDPDFILLGDAMWGTTAESVAQRTGWDQLTAVQQGRVLPFNDDLLSRPGPRQVEGIEALAKLFHPDLFE